MRSAAQAFSAVFRNRELRRVELAFAAFNGAEWATWIAMLVYAYEQGGATTAGLVALVQLVPAGLFAPFAAVLSDRRGPARVLVWGYAAQAATMGATGAALLADAPQPLVYALAACAATSITLTRPSQAALVPALARRPSELTAANVVSGWIESLSMLVAPAATGVLLAVSGPGTVFVVMAALALAGGGLVLGLRGPGPAAGETGGVAEMVAGFRLLVREPAPRLVVVLLGVQFVGIGALDVLLVVLAIGVLDLGASWAGYLNAAFGAGGVLGIVVTAVLCGRRHLAPALAVGVGIWFVALVVLAVNPTAASALVLLAAAGAGRSLLDVAGRTLLQRIAPTEVLSRVFGVLEGLAMAGLAAGSLLAPLLIGLGGAESALVAIALVLPLVALLGARGLRQLDRRADVPVVEIGLLRSMPLFAGLGAPELERLARELVAVTAGAGETVVREGDPGDRFLVVADGELEVSVGGVPAGTLRRGDGFGEIALLRDVPRTATVVAATSAGLYALEREPFVETVTGNPLVAREAHRVVRERLETAS